MVLVALLSTAVIIGRESVYAQPEDSHWIETEGAASAKSPESVIRAWPPLAQTIAKTMIEKYGLPHQYSDNALVWINNGPWRKTVVHRAGWPHRAGMRDTDYLEQSISYEVAPDQVLDLRRFDRRLMVDTATGELSSRSASEPLNFLALNLADEILKGNRSVASARRFYRKTTRLAMAGKSSRYTARFQFKGHRFMNQVYYP
jgi:hypothetical protein